MIPLLLQLETDDGLKPDALDRDAAVDDERGAGHERARVARHEEERPVELVLETGRPSAEHVLNVLGRLKEPLNGPAEIQTDLTLNEPPRADVSRYDRLRTNAEADHVE